MKTSIKWMRYVLSVTAAIAALLSAGVPVAQAEYADVVINNYADKAGMRPVVFPHWYHRIRFACKVCHADLGFKFKAGGNEINMAKIIDGQFCGACHNGEIAWSVENCNMCHSGIPGTPTQFHNSSQGRLFAGKGGASGLKGGGATFGEGQTSPSDNKAGKDKRP
ncbi:MAG: c(7)-type cytochrome triheme domain-containing protein [Pseudomonadota bacterium]